MPGPRNSKKKGQKGVQKANRPALKALPQNEVANASIIDHDTQAKLNDAPAAAAPPLADDVHELRDTSNPFPNYPSIHPQDAVQQDKLMSDSSIIPATLPEPASQLSISLPTSFITNPGTGPRIQDMAAYLSSFFAPPPSYNDPLCASLSYPQVFTWLTTLLPYELALMLWYNKTRQKSRVCLACRRLYNLGDTLSDPVTGADMSVSEGTKNRVLREQQLSGFCCSLCFILASYDHPELAPSTWGRTVDELGQSVLEVLREPGKEMEDSGLGIVVYMTRWEDLGISSALQISTSTTDVPSNLPETTSPSPPIEVTVN